jgi:hypothetical protein
VNELQTVFVCSLRKSERQTARELSMPQSTVHNIMQNSCCKMYEPKTWKLGPHFSVMFFQNLKTIIFSQQELCLVTNPLSTLTTPILEKEVLMTCYPSKKEVAPPNFRSLFYPNEGGGMEM